jgi:RsmE family RNA methyltransferase
VNLLLLDRAEIDAGGGVALSGLRAVHLLNVLHVAPGHLVRIGVIDGPRGTATVQSIADGAVVLGCVLEEGGPAPRPAVDLLLAVPRPKVMRRLWAQIAALGVGQIILTNAEKVERNYFDTHVLAPEHYRPLLIEGLQQSRDTRLPVVSIHRQFKVLVEDQLDTLFGRGVRVVADPSAVTPLMEVVRSATDYTDCTDDTDCTDYAQRTLLAIGPEGGWNAFELALLQAHGFRPAGMGPRTLRTDTACVALLALAHGARSG